MRREVLYNIVIEFGIPLKLVGPIEMCLKKSKVCIDNNLSDNISYSEWSETRRCFIVIAFHLCFRIQHQESP